MKRDKEAVEQLKGILEAGGYQWQNYSGRGMYGRECVSVKAPDSELIIISHLIEGTQGDLEMVEALADALRFARVDGMGMGTVLYFPDYTVEVEEDEG